MWKIINLVSASRIQTHYLLNTPPPIEQDFQVYSYVAIFKQKGLN